MAWSDLTPAEIVALVNAAAEQINASQIDTSMATDAELAAHSAAAAPHSGHLSESSLNNMGVINVQDFTTGSDVFFAHDAQVTSVVTALALKKTIHLDLLNMSTLRLYFEIRSNVNGQPAKAQIYRNGSPVGTLQENTTTGFVPFTENIGGWAEGDDLEVWLRGTTSVNTAYLINFRILADIKEIWY
ncbi:MAG: hypothetical protein KAJ19_11210 [Gammaproteobacteria bacterium]|nr:hypothetical protein [Gammaproteobacteria bacterium]